MSTIAVATRPSPNRVIAAVAALYMVLVTGPVIDI